MMSEKETKTRGEAKSVFYDLFEPEIAQNLTIRAQLMRELEQVLKARFKTQGEAAAFLGVSQARISDLYRGKIQLFTIDMLVNFLVKTGQQLTVTVQKAA